MLVIHISEVGRSEIWYLIGTQKLPSVTCLGHQYLKTQGDVINPLTPKIQLLILPSGCNTFLCRVVVRI